MGYTVPKEKTISKHSKVNMRFSIRLLIVPSSIKIRKQLSDLGNCRTHDKTVTYEVEEQHRFRTNNLPVHINAKSRTNKVLMCLFEIFTTAL